MGAIDLTGFALDDGVHLISPPQQFEGGEEAYDQHIGGAARADLLLCGQGAWRLATRYSARTISSVLELGAGGGTCSLGLIAAAPEAEHLITDTSPRFLRMIGAKLAAADIGHGNVRFATVAGEDLSLLPGEGFDTIIIASALHHVGDWRGFLRDAVRTLRPGGTLVIQEPCREGNLMMGMALDTVLSPLWPENDPLPAEDAERILRCRDSIYYLANSHIEKIGEDKHSFLATELATAADEAGFARSIFYSNFHFRDLALSDLSIRQGTCSFVQYLDSFLAHHHRLSADAMEKLRAHLFPTLHHLDAAFRGGDGVPLVGCMVFCK
jgi:ubiquinone/menaquinone biosynthesis C-methylase UbiE